MNTPRQQPPRSGSSSQQPDAQTTATGSQKGPGSQPVRSAGGPATKTAGVQSSPQRASGTEAALQPSISSPQRSSGTAAPLQPSVSEDPGRAARALGREASDAAASLKSDLQQTARAATRAAQEQASAFAADVGHEINKAAEEQKTRGVDAMQGFARAISSAAGELEDQSPTVARYVRDAAKQVDSLSNNIRGRNVTELMHAATDLARTQPAVFFAGAMAAGFALSRFLKSSATGSVGGSAPASHAGSSTRGSPMAGSSPTSRNLSPDTPTASTYVPGGRPPSTPRNS